jgi:uncharacterized protein YndB with AHSA1/START domain
MSDLGTITRCYTLTFERVSRHSAQRLWRAITDARDVARWMGYPARIDLRVGGDYHVDFSRTGGGALDGVIVRLEPERSLALVWGLSVLAWQLEPDETGCRYTFVHHGQPAPEDPDRDDIGFGWHVWLDDFAAHLDGTSRRVDAATHGRNELRVAYRERRDAVLGSA